MSIPNGPQPDEDAELLAARNEGGGVSRFGIALAAVCFFITALWAGASAITARLAATPICFPKRQPVTQKNQFHPKQTSPRGVSAQRVNLKPNP